MNLSANHFPGEEQISLRSLYSWWTRYLDIFISLNTAPELTSLDTMQTRAILRHIINTRQDGCHMRYRVANLSQQNPNVLLRHLYCLLSGLLKSCLKQHSNMLCTEERQPFDFMVASSKLLLGPLLIQFFHRKPGRFTRLKGLKLQVFRGQESLLPLECMLQPM